MIIAYHSQKLIPIAKLRELPGVSLCRGFDGKISNKPVQVVLALDPEQILFHARVDRAPICNHNLKSGEYREGLWESDLVELFIKDDNNNNYFELNLAPGGAWWGCNFSAPRVRISTKHEDLLREINSRTTDKGWEVTVALKRDRLPVSAAFNQSSRGNVSACLGAPPRELLTISPLPGEKPDFHQPQHFAAVLPILLSPDTP